MWRKRYHVRYPAGMAAFLVRLDDSELEALREAAEAQGRSMNDVAREGLRAVTSQAAREDTVRALTRRVLSDHANLLKRLGEA
jgi:plasmid stability protein